MIDGDTSLVLVMGGLHAAALVAAVVLMALAFRGGDAQEPGEESGGGGPGVRPGPSRPPSGGPPLEHARPARVRLRTSGRLGDLIPAAPRRPAHGPSRPAPERVPHAEEVRHG